MLKHLSADDAAQWLRSLGVERLLTDSRRIRPGDGFLAWPGGTTDSRAFVLRALADGAAACLIEQDGVEAFDLEDARIAAIPSLKAASGRIAAAFHEHPSRSLKVIAVTGTNGKTSTTWWLAHAFDRVAGVAGACGVVGTLGIGRAGQLSSTGLTTPDPVVLQESFRDFVDRGCTRCAIEASSIGIAEERLAGSAIQVGVFTNFTQDHLDYHGTMEAYWSAKRALFEWPDLGAAVINLDDPKGRELCRLATDRGLDLWTYGVDACDARLVAVDIRLLPSGVTFSVQEGVERTRVISKAFGTFNVSNLMAVIAAMRSQGHSLFEAAEACSSLPPVPGRMEVVDAALSPTVLVDYAHTPDALDKSLATARSIATLRGGRLWCVFGCGGDRDPIKRPIMGAVAEAGADRVVITSDNPRSEDPMAIVNAIRAGFSGPESVVVELDRARAIAQTINAADKQDVILLAGKGHETYQESCGLRVPFSDRAHARIALKSRSRASIQDRFQNE